MKRLKTAAFLLLAAAVAGCAGVDTAGLAPSAGANDQAAAPAGSNPGGSDVSSVSSQAAAPATRSAAIAAARVQFAPVIGAAAEAIEPLSRRLSTRAGQHGLTITREAENATLLVKGYFSTITENGRTTVIYVWDVLDPAGTRLHRIQGQEIARGGNGEGWPAVTATTMETIADRTIDELTAWLANRSA